MYVLLNLKDDKMLQNVVQLLVSDKGDKVMEINLKKREI